MASPLSGLLNAWKQRSSASFHLGVCLMGLISSCMWAIYAVVSSLYVTELSLPVMVTSLSACKYYNYYYYTLFLPEQGASAEKLQ